MDIINLQETWLEEKERKKWENKLPKDFIWKPVHVRKEKKKGRAKGGILIGMRK